MLNERNIFTVCIRENLRQTLWMNQCEDSGLADPVCGHRLFFFVYNFSFSKKLLQFCSNIDFVEN